MSLPVVSDEVTRRLEAALFLSQREIFLRLIQEAELLVQIEQFHAAALLAGIVLEEATQLLSTSTILDQEQVNVWREIRSRSTHYSLRMPDVSDEQVSAMLSGIRQMLQVASPESQSQGNPLPSINGALAQTRGKYAFVQTSVDEFLQRKRKDLEREDSQWQ